uniref:Uncharacterized protein n=1 Tax=Octopus bimaculoides TaxID=37653 RepID=A0A0L8GZC5_OCTBM
MSLLVSIMQLKVRHYFLLVLLGSLKLITQSDGRIVWGEVVRVCLSGVVFPEISHLQFVTFSFIIIYSLNKKNH